MNAPLAATLICLCCPVMTVVAAPGEAPPPASVQPGPAPQPESMRRPSHQQVQQPSAAASRPPVVSERGLVLAGLVLMAGIALRRRGDGAP